MDKYGSAAFTTPPCTNCAGETGMAAVTGSSAPTLEDIARYNYMTPTQQQMQKQQLQHSGGSPFPGIPGPGPTEGGSITVPITPTTQPQPMSTESIQYLNGFLRTQIGRAVRVEFLIGTNTMVDRTGILLGVGANYILINEAETDDIVACDFYNIKFIKFYY